MARWARYNSRDDVIDVTVVDVAASAAIIDEIFDEITAIAKRLLPRKTHVLVCLRNTTIGTEVAAHYGERMAGLQSLVRGTARYDATESLTRVHVRAEVVKRGLQGSKAHLYPSREEALAAIRRGDVG